MQSEIESPQHLDNARQDAVMFPTQYVEEKKKNQTKEILLYLPSTSFITRKQLPLLQNLRNLLRILNRTPPIPHQQQFLRVRRQAQIRRWFPLRQTINPGGEVLEVVSFRDSKSSIAFSVGRCFLSESAFDEPVVDLEGLRCEEGIDEFGELVEVAFVIDLAAVCLCDEGPDEVPGDVGGSDVCSTVGDESHPEIDDVGCTFVLFAH